MNNSISRFRLSLLGAVLAAFTTPAFAAGGFSFLYGNKSLDSTAWWPVESQREMAFSFEYQGAEWPVTLLARYAFSQGLANVTESGFTLKVRGTTTEMGLGLRKYLTESRVRPFIEAGLISVKAEMSAEIAGYSAARDDSGIGLWVGAGVSARLSDAWSIGLLGRISSADVTLAGVSGNAGGQHVSAFITQHFY